MQLLIAVCFFFFSFLFFRSVRCDRLTCNTQLPGSVKETVAALILILQHKWSLWHCRRSSQPHPLPGLWLKMQSSRQHFGQSWYFKKKWRGSGVFLDGGAGGLAGTDGPEGIISGEKSFRLIFTDCVSGFQKALICRLQWPSHILSMVSHPVQRFSKFFSSFFALFYSVKYVHIPLLTWNTFI